MLTRKQHRAPSEARASRAGKLTERERAAIRRFAVAYAERKGLKHPDRIKRYLLDWASDQGFAAFERLKTGYDSGRTRNIDAMLAFADRYNLPDVRWLYYH